MTLPVATASTVTTNEDTAHTFVTGDFSYTDVEGDALVSVTFNSLNLAGGTLEHSGGTAVTNGMTLTAAQIATLVYTPATDANGAPLATFDFTVNDADAGVTAAQMDIDVTAVNDAPTTNNVSASGNEDAASIAITLTGGDIDGTVDNYVLNGLPANGTLYLDAGSDDCGGDDDGLRGHGRSPDPVLRPERQLERQYQLPVCGQGQQRCSRCHAGHGDDHGQCR